ncbi:MAG: hypothetical protein NE330_08190 [Lentisphaeraceae bacterium]|nr:hypothetical protein [Lentisphaeraceae bacterium]
MKIFLLVMSAFLLTACNENTSKTANTSQNEEHQHDHGHMAPNGGVLTEIGDHSASLEWLIEDGQFKVFIFDGCAEKPIRVAQEKLKVSVKADNEKILVLAPVTNKLTGEEPGDSNTFHADASGLSKESILGLSLSYVTIQGIDYKNINLKVK